MEELNKPKVSVSSIVVSAVLAAVIFGGGIYAYQSNQAKKDKDTLKSQITTLETEKASLEKQVNNQTIAVTVPAATDEIASWKIYTNDKYGFSFKYPKEWISVKKDANDNMNWVATFQSSDFSVSDGAVISSGERIKLAVQSPSTETWTQILDAGFGLECQNVIKNDKTGKIDSVNAWIVEAYGDDKCEINPGIIQSWGRGRILSASNDQISLDYSAKDKSTLSIYDLILSTFKFGK